ncbi:MAG: DNA translocase FtsK [Ignavibacteria bacterium]|nr:DNA translocase FtsK [Ignavibacteria bacterium]
MPVQVRSRNGFTLHGQRAARNSIHRKKSVIAILLMATAVLIFLSLVSYDPADEASAEIHFTDLFKVFSGDELVQAKADTARNWLGLVGALISDFLIQSTIGYNIFCLPLLLMLFGWTILRNANYNKIVSLANYTLVGALLVSASFGMTRLILGPDSFRAQWSGVVGDFMATILAQLLGRVGGSIVLVTAVLVVTVLVVDLDLRRSTDRVRSGYLRLMDWLSRKKETWRNRRLVNPKKILEPSIRTSVKGIVKISKPLSEESDFATEPELLLRRSSVRQFEPEEAAGDETSIAHLAGDRHKEVRVEIESKAGEAEVNLDKPESGSRQTPAEEIDYVFPSVELLNPLGPGREDIDEDELKANADLLRDTLAQFDVELESVSVTPGPVVTLYELVPASGVKISRIVSLENDMALKLEAKGIRIMAPIPGKAAVGVEIPNHNRALVTIRSVINSSRFRDTQAKLPIAMGKTISGEVFADDLSKMPHLLMAGSTGSGKSVGINTIITSLLYRMHPSDLKLVIIDPKKIELAQYAKLRNHYLAISPDAGEEIITNPRSAVLALRGVEYEMENRYDKLAAAGVRNIIDYNERVKSGQIKSGETGGQTKIPYLVVVIDELADLMITAAREVEEPIARLAQLARAVGIHLVVATQRPSVDVITGVIKANFPARVAYQVSSKVDSRTILDLNGAEQLLGHGDMLYLASGSPKPVRLQNAYISSEEVDALLNHIVKQQGYSKPFMLPSITERKRSAQAAGNGDRDELFEEAAKLIVRHQQGSVSLLQRRLKVGYSRAARLVDELEAAGVVGAFDGSKAREVLVESEVELNAIING